MHLVQQYLYFTDVNEFILAAPLPGEKFHPRWGMKEKMIICVSEPSAGFG